MAGPGQYTEELSYSDKTGPESTLDAQILAHIQLFMHTFFRYEYNVVTDGIHIQQKMGPCYCILCYLCAMAGDEVPVH